MEKSWPTVPGHPPPLLPPDNFTARLHGKKREPGYDELPLSTDWNISVRMLCVVRLGPAMRVDSLETVYTRTKLAHLSWPPCLANRVTLPPGSSYSPSQVFSFSCKRSTMIYKQLYGKLGSPRLARWGGSPDHLFSAWTGPKFLLTDGNVNVIHSFAGIYFSRFRLSSSLIEFLLAFILPGKKTV